VIELRGARVLVTGATGFIGGRLVERLVVQEGARVRALVRSFGTAARIGRFPIEMAHGDLLDHDAVDRAMIGCDVAFHCAYGNAGEDDSRKAVNVKGTEHLLEAAVRHGVRRVVHVSTFSVYGDPSTGDVTETSPRRYTGNAYGDSKIDAEKLALGYVAKGLSVAVVQPTVVYGPLAQTWTVKPLQQLSSGGVILVDDGRGVCNAVYIDDVIEVMIRAAQSPAAHGQAFLASGTGPLTWREYYNRYELMLGRAATIPMTADEARAHYAQLAPKGLIRETLRVLRRETAKRAPVVRARLTGSRLGRIALAAGDRFGLFAAVAADDPTAAGPQPVHPSKIDMYRSTARVRIDKASSVLGYHPAFDIERGMATTEAWARWANLIPNAPTLG